MTDDDTDVLSLLTDLHLGPVTLPAPDQPPRQLDGSHGHLWQWVGDGEPLLSLSVAVRETRLGRTAAGLAHHLTWETEQVRQRLDEGRTSQVEPLPVEVPGAADARAATVDGTRDGMDVRTGVVVCTHADLMHVIQVAARDGAAGRALAQEVALGIRVHPWTLPR